MIETKEDTGTKEDTIIAPEGFKFASFSIRQHLIRKMEEEDTPFSLCYLRPFLITKGPEKQKLLEPITTWTVFSDEAYKTFACNTCLKNHRKEQRLVETKDR